MYNNSRSLLEISTQHSSDRISETGRFATNVYINFFVTFIIIIIIIYLFTAIGFAPGGSDWRIHS
jgi:hypothetical protein